ncbi:MAG: hypothetical protein Q8P80_02025 [Candidatus Levybacteria bacterium]|nr:hypothetical protein [Candidatus Levybacteria bacterium]
MKDEEPKYKGEGLENSGQNSYAEKKEEKQMDGNSTPENAENTRPERLAQPEPEVPISENPIVNKRAQEVVKEYAKEELQNLGRPQRVSEPVQTSRAEAKKFIPNVPPNVRVNSAVNDFYREYSSQPEIIETDFLIKHYLKISRAAEREGVDTGFLSELRKELVTRKIDVSALKIATDNALSWVEAVSEGRIDANTAAQGIETGYRIQEERVIKEVDIPRELPDGSIKKRLERLNQIMKAKDEPDLDYMRDIFNEIANLEGVDETHRKRAMDSITDCIKNVRRQQEKREHFQRETQKKREEQAEKKGSWYKERLITEAETEDIRNAIQDVAENSEPEDTMESLLDKLRPVDQLFNRMFDRAEVNPRKEFNDAMGAPGVQEYQHWVTMLNELRESYAGNFRKQDLIKRLGEKYTAEYQLRQLLHNVYYIAETGGEPKQFADYTKQFQSEFADLAFLGSPEVESAFRIREQVLYQIKRECGGTIPYEKVAFIPHKGWSEWEKRSEALLREENEKGMFGERLDPWKIDRAVSISRGMGMVLLRFPEIVAECPLRDAPKSVEGQPSIPWETIAWELNPLDHKIKRYDIAREMHAIFYNALNRKKRGLWSQDELKTAVAYDMMAAFGNIDSNERMIDLRNLTKIGGWATHSSWRSMVAAFEEDQSGLRPLLDGDPGMSMRLIWNQYEIAGLNKARKEFVRQYKQTHPDYHENGEEFVKAWEVKKKELEASNSGKWEEADINTWRGAAKRIPHVILRILTDDANRLMSSSHKKELLREIFGNLDDQSLQKAYTETESDLTFAKERLMKRRREKGQAFNIETEDMLIDEDFSVIGDSARIERAKTLQRVTQRELENESLQKKLISKVKNKEFPFALTNEDVPFGEYRFAQTGGRGLVTRRNNDWFKDVEANEAMIEMLKHINRYQGPEQIVEMLGKIFDATEVHDRDRAEDLVGYLSTGIIRFYEKDGILKAPILGEIMGPINALRGRGSSYAQTLYGINAMSWDSDDIYNFTEQLRQKILTGVRGKDIVRKLQKETGGTLFQALGKKTKLALYLLFLFGGYEFISKTATQK